jgi:hypothetical protein
VEEGGDEVAEEDGGLPIGEFGLADAVTIGGSAAVEGLDELEFCDVDIGEGDGKTIGL